MTEPVRVVVVDVETTGLGFTRQDAVVEVGYAYRDPALDEIVTWSEVVNPGRDLLAGGRARDAFRVNGFTEERVLAARSATDVARTLRRRLATVAPKAMWTAYNAQFDRRFLEAEPWEMRDAWGPCVMQEAMRQLGLRGRRLSLAEACRRLAVTVPGREHSAARDAEAALRVWEGLTY